ncbi:Dps family protein [Candidatus Viridilinea mediisalina]|uniref:DNA starvation/stationary phase protection protein n=1 Tax=Candidatus Viridilinea mediisalina TaxID=2024553 RepID=A0A2A6RKX1_9CHLR|nr:DNA starvation/stationary phase protection protein [Candidatus Viridilinea mediisalina]PDW03518.1 DNA starvation/stationary phase protection protein [Candidatus Viridilinea mediisalina]
MTTEIAGQITTTPTPDLGLSAANTQGVATLLARLLADEHVLYMRLRNYHWNIVGMAFGPLHALFQEQYEALADDIDDIAERIRMLGPNVPGTLTEMLQLTTLAEQPGDLPDDRSMIKQLVADHEAIIRNLRNDVRASDEQYDDMGTSDYLTGLMEKHEKMAWLLRAHIEQRG